MKQGLHFLASFFVTIFFGSSSVVAISDVHLCLLLVALALCYIC
jgi:hypothetical protein